MEDVAGGQQQGGLDFSPDQARQVHLLLGTELDVVLASLARTYRCRCLAPAQTGPSH